jgi:hypothetical protein
MAFMVQAFAATIPAGTPFSAMYSQALAVTDYPVVAIHWRVPPGPRGHLGWLLAQSGAPVLPLLGGMIVADGQSDTWPLDNIPQSGAWSVQGYNTGTLPHTVYLEFELGQAGGGGGPVLTGDINAGFPTADSQIPSMWLA